MLFYFISCIALEYHSKTYDCHLPSLHVTWCEKQLSMVHGISHKGLVTRPLWGSFHRTSLVWGFFAHWISYYIIIDIFHPLEHSPGKYKRVLFQMVHLNRFWEDVFLSHFSNGKVFLIQFWRGSLILSASETVFYWLNLFSLVNLVIYGSSQVSWDQSNGPCPEYNIFCESFWIPSQLRTDDPFNRRIIPRHLGTPPHPNRPKVVENNSIDQFWLYETEKFFSEKKHITFANKNSKISTFAF